MPNAASPILAPSARPSLPKVEYQASGPDGSAFAGLLDIGTEAPPPPPERSSPRANDERETTRSDAPRENDPPSHADAPERSRDQVKDAAPNRDSPAGTATTNKADAGNDASKSDDKGDGKKAAGDADTDTSSDGDTQTTTSAVAATDALLQVVTPVAIAIAADQAADTTSASEKTVDAVSAATPTAQLAADATFSLSGVVDKTVKTAPVQSSETEDAGAQAQAAIAAATKPAQSPHLKQTPKADKTSEAADKDADTSEAADSDGVQALPEHELAKSLHAANEAKTRHPEQLADAHIEAKTTADSVSPPVAAGNAQPAQTTAPAGLLQASAAGSAVNGAQAPDARAASQPATDGVVPIAGLAVEITTRAKEGKNRFEIRLDPPDLGRIDVRLDIDRQGNVTSRLLVERADTLDLLRRDFGNLERALNDAGLKTDSGSLQFAMRDQGFAGGGQQQQNEFARSARIVVPGEIEPTTTNAARYNFALRSGVDIRV